VLQPPSPTTSYTLPLHALFRSDPLDLAATQARDQFARHRPAQVRLAHHEVDHAPADEMRLESAPRGFDFRQLGHRGFVANGIGRSEEHTSELQSRENLVCRLLL